MNRLAPLAALTLALYAPAMAATVKSDHDAAFDFTRPKTFTWLTKDFPQHPFAHARIVKAVETQLTAKGMQGVPEGGDLKVAYHVVVGQRTQITDWGYGPRWGGHSIDVHQYTEGTVVVDLIDAAQDQLVWRGSATDVLSNNAETNEKRLNKAMAKLFKKFPPAAK